MKITDGLVEQHIHGAFGIDFMNCEEDDFLRCSDMLATCGVGAYFPTVMTADIEIIKDRLKIIKSAQKRQSKNTAKIIGVHLEGPFINPEKAGIHDKKFILPLDVDLFKKIEDDIVKIITLSPELDYTGDFLKYLKGRNIKISAGHSLTADLSSVVQVTHLYNAMGTFSHRAENTTVKALVNNEIYTEIIADSMHVSDDVLKITFAQKPADKVILISDALPLAHSDKKSHIFAGQNIFNKNGRLVNSDGVFAGSSMLLCDIVKNLTDKDILKFEDAIKYASSNQIFYHNIKNNLKVFWNELNEIETVEFV